jgi:hypothetical protein
MKKSQSKIPNILNIRAIIDDTVPIRLAPNPAEPEPKRN